MKKYLFVIARYKDNRQDLFEEYISPKNQEYCQRHGLEYILVDNSWDLPDFRGNITWHKFWLVRQFLQEGRIKIGDSVVHFDADMVVVKPEFEYKTNKSFSYAIDNCNSHCMGNFCIKVNEWSVGLIESILEESFYQTNKESKHWRRFREQAAWYSLAGIDPFCRSSYLAMPNNGFHSSNIAAKYSLEELAEHVEIKSPIWDCTFLSEEMDNPAARSLSRFYKNKTKQSETIIRHFAGKQPWRREYII